MFFFHNLNSANLFNTKKVRFTRVFANISEVDLFSDVKI